MSYYIERKVREIIQEKKKYFSKVLSLNAMSTNFDRVSDVEEQFNYWAWQFSQIFLWIDISSLFIFGLDPSVLEPLNIDFKIELPSLEEFLQGIKLKFEKVDVGDIWKEFNWEYFKEEVPPKLDYETFVKENVQEPYQPSTLEQAKRKLIVGQTKYGEGYVDPQVIYELLRATFYEFLKRREDLERLRHVYLSCVKKLGINEAIAEAVFNRIASMIKTFYDNFILGFNLLGVSKLTPRASKSALAEVITWKREYAPIEYTKFAEINCGFILGVTPLGFGLLLPREYFLKPARVKLAPKITYFIDYKVRKLLSRYRATHIGFANYQKPDEMLKYYRSERCEQYTSLQFIRYYIDGLVENWLRGKGIDRFKMNLYKRAVMMLIGHRKKRHKWGYAAFKAMTEDEFKEFWLDYWEKQGLNRDILIYLYEKVKTWLPNLRKQVRELGEYLKKKRQELARLLG